MPRIPLAFPLRGGNARSETESVRSKLKSVVKFDGWCSPMQAATMSLAWLCGLGLAGCGVMPQVGDPGGGDGKEVQPFTFQISVSRHEEQPFSEQRVNRVFTTANALLLSDDSDCSDVSCPVTFERDGSVSTFNDAPAIITTEAQLDAVFDDPGDIKVVTLMVGVCGSPSADDVSLVLGCAFTGGTAVLVQDAPPDVWAHEWGHVQGLPHRDDCARNLMHAFELETDAVNTTERDAFLSATPGQGFLAFKSIFEGQPIPIEETQSATPLDSEEPASLGDLMNRRYLAGLPTALLNRHQLRLRGADLLTQLSNEPSPRNRANVVRVLGLTQVIEACESMLTACGSISGELEIDELDELIEQILALGRLADIDDSKRTTDLLLAGSDPSFWHNRNLMLRLDDDRRLGLEDALARVCVLGLGLSKDPTAPEHLLALKRKAQANPQADPWFIPQVDEALARIEGTGKYAKAGVAQRMP